MGSAAEKIKEKPMVSMMLVAGTVAAAAVSLVTFTDVADTLVVTHLELNDALQSHVASLHPGTLTMMQAAADEREEIRRESRCQTLEIKIALIEQQIWDMEQAGTSARLVEKRRELRELEAKQTQLNCADF